MYSSYLFLLPKYLDNSIIENAINSFILKDSKLTLDIDKFKVQPNYKFDINLKADSIKIIYPNKKNFLIIKNPDIDINLFSLFFGYIDLNKIKTDEIKVNVVFTKDNEYSCFNYIDFKDSNVKFKIRNINIFANSFEFNLFDENIQKNFLLKTDKIHIATSDYKKPIEISTKGMVRSSNHKISDFDLKLLVKLNETFAGELKQKICNLNYNPFYYADKYKFYLNSKIDLKFNPTDKKNNVVGFIALNEYTFELNGLKLPKNYLILNFKNNKIVTDCDFKFLNEQYIKIKSTLVLNKNFIETKLTSNKLNLSDLKDALSVVGKIFNFNIDLTKINISGQVVIDAYLKSNFKSISSNGVFLVKNAEILHKKTGLVLKNINSDINFANNKIDILKTTAYVNGAKFNLFGNIDSETNLNLKINSDEMNIAQVLALFKELPFSNVIVPKLKDYHFKSGLLKMDSQILGTLNNPIINSKSCLTNLRVFAKKYKANVCVPKIDVKFLQSDVIIPRTKVFFESVPLFVEGKIKNYKTNNSEVILNIDSNLDKDNKFIKIKDNDAELKCNLNIKQNKLDISTCNISNMIFIGGEVLNLNKSPQSNLKISFSENSSFILPKMENLEFSVKGNILINGDVEKPNVVGNLILKNLRLANIGLKISDLILNIKNSELYFNVANGNIFNFNFNLTSNVRIQKDKIIIETADINSDYINIDNFVKYSSSLDLVKKLNYEINSLKANILAIETSDILLNSVVFEGNVKDNILDIVHFNADVLNGKVDGVGRVDFSNKETRAEFKLNDINIRQFPQKLKELSIATSGKLSAAINAKFIGFDLDNILNTLVADIDFSVKNGELAQFAKLERFLQAGNILSQSIFKSNFSALTKQSSGDFKIIQGKFGIKDSIADIQYINTQGSNMSLNIVGEFNLLNQNIDVKILGRIPNEAVNILDGFDKKDSMTSIEKRFTTYLNENEFDKIPQLAYQVGEVQTREFFVLIDGMINNLNSIKEFKWVIKN
ncbi:MAG: hypothetical protein IKU37_02675 [Candidatus Gastranaerophilales bacterium]|nr:hypothetical protein [Candidatus Gastranaerophilales bacterium]